MRPVYKESAEPMATPVGASDVTGAKPVQTEELPMSPQMWDVDIGQGGWGLSGIMAVSPKEAIAKAVEQLRSQGEDVAAYDMHAYPTSRSSRGQVQREMGCGSAGVMGSQQPIIGDPERMKETIRQLVREIIRKKAGGGGYNLYPPNKGKKKAPKPVGEFPTRLAAKEVELSRFPPKDPEQLKKARAKLDKIKKDPKKRAAAIQKDLTGRAPTKKSGSPKRAPKRAPRRESMFDTMSRAIDQSLRESLFREDEVPGSPWDERMSSMHPDAISGDKRLHGLHRAMEKGSISALGDAHKGMSKALRGIAKVTPGEIGNDPARRKKFMPVHLDVDGSEIGPIHLYIDGGHVRIELSQDARSQITKLEPPDAQRLRGGLMTFEEDHLPKIGGALRPWQDRDAYLDKMHGKLDGALGKMSPVELHLARQLMGTKHRGRR